MPHSLTRAPNNRLVVATGNAAKLREFRALLAGLPFEVVSQAELGVAPPPETGATFADNALLKARHAAAATGAAAIADDSGLEVDALRGAPGVYSARYAGADAANPECADAANNAKLIAALAGVATAERGARYRCVLAFVRGPSDPAPVTAEGVWEGLVLDTPRGGGGFGYDPYFWLPAHGMTAAELPPAEKNRLSHRGRALAALRDAMVAALRAAPARQSGRR